MGIAAPTDVEAAISVASLAELHYWSPRALTNAPGAPSDSA